MQFNEHWSLKLVGILVFVFVLQLIFPQITDFFLLQASDIFTRPWILVTSVFLHSGLLHLILNGFALALFGSILEEIISSKRFLMIFFIGGIVASFVFVLGLPILAFVGMPSSGNALGASGAIFSVMGMLAVLRPTMTVWVSYMPMPLWVAALVWTGQDFFGIFIPDNIANFAHLGGLFFGVIIGFFYKKKYLDRQKKYLQKRNDIMLSNEEIDTWERNTFRF